MKKLRRIPRFYGEIISTVVLLIALWLLWNFIIKEYVVISDQGLSTIGIALSTSVGVLTAIVVSFVLILWQFSRQGRAAAFWRWSEDLDHLIDFVDARLGKLGDVEEKLIEFTKEAGGVNIVNPMPRDKFVKLKDGIFNKMSSEQDLLRTGDVDKAKNEMIVAVYLKKLTASYFQHKLSHESYENILSLKALVYRLLVLLAANVFFICLAASTVIDKISDAFTTPLAAVLIAWVMYVLILLGREIRRISLLEEEFRKQEDIQFPRAV